MNENTFFETKRQEVSDKNQLTKRLEEALSRKRLFEALEDTQYESAQEKYDELRAINIWRKQASHSPAREFYKLVENFSVLESGNYSAEEKKYLQDYLTDRMSGTISRLGSRAGDLYAACLARIAGSAYEPKFPLTREKMAEMEKTNDIEYLTSNMVSMERKLEYLTKRFDAYIAGCNALDGFEDAKKNKEMSEEEKQERQEKLENESTDPANDEEESKPSMDEMSRLKEGEKAQAIWTIAPARGGYFREKSFDAWDPIRKKWTRTGDMYTEFIPASSNESNENTVTMTANIASGVWKRMPFQYTHTFAGVSGGNGGFKFRQDGSGGVSIFRENNGTAPIELLFTEQSGGRTFTDVPRAMEISDTEQFSQETQAAIEEIKNTRQGNLSRAFALARYTRTHLTYSNDSSFNEVYENDSHGYCFAIDTHRQADCDVANTYFAGLCRTLDIPVRHVVGHMVKGKYEGDTSAITSGTGHAWSEVWDEVNREWRRIDATPAGDPNMEEESDQKESENIPGDYGEQEAINPSDEALEKLAEKLSKHVEQLSYTPAERKIAEDTGIELQEARQIMKEIIAAEETKLPDGRRVSDVLAQLFSMIVESRTHFEQEYTGPIRRRDGGEYIDNIVKHYIGTQAGESDPLSRAKEKDVRKEEQLMSGFDVYNICDKSGSMTNVDAESGLSIWEMQRRTNYLELLSLHRFEEKLARSGVQSVQDKSLDILTQTTSFRGGDPETDLDVDKSLSPVFTSADKVALWYSLTNPGGGSGELMALRDLRDQLQREKDISKDDNQSFERRLRLVFLFSDGGFYTDESEIHTTVEELGQLGVVVVGIGLGESASAVETLFTTEHSRGVCAKNMNDLIRIVAKYVILETMKLFPEKARKQSKQSLEMMIRSLK